MNSKGAGAICLKGSIDIVCEFFEYGINSILYQRGLYPADSFIQQEKYGLPLLMTSNVELKRYLDVVLNQLRTFLLNKNVHKIVVVIIKLDTMDTVERWQFDVDLEKPNPYYNPLNQQTEQQQQQQHIPLVATTASNFHQQGVPNVTGGPDQPPMTPQPLQLHGQQQAIYQQQTVQLNDLQSPINQQQTIPHQQPIYQQQQQLPPVQQQMHHNYQHRMHQQTPTTMQQPQQSPMLHDQLNPQHIAQQCEPAANRHQQQSMHQPPQKQLAQHHQQQQQQQLPPPQQEQQNPDSSNVLKEIQDSIKGVVRQITASVTFLPVLEGSHSFDILLYTDKDVELPNSEWSDTNARLINNGEHVQLRGFTTHVHRVAPVVSYRPN